MLPAAARKADGSQVPRRALRDLLVAKPAGRAAGAASRPLSAGRAPGGAASGWTDPLSWSYRVS
jgi:hypothetical protein